MSKPGTNKKTIGAVERTLEILETLSEYDGARVTDLANALDVSKGTVHHHLTTLHQQGYVVKDGNRYAVGTRFLTLGGYAARRKRIYENGRSEVDRLAERTGLCACLAIEESGRIIYLYQSRGERAADLELSVGQEAHKRRSTAGKAILSHLSRDSLERVLAEPTDGGREQSVADVQEALSDVRERKTAFDDGERTAGVRSVAAPVLSTDGESIGAVEIRGPTDEIDDDAFEQELPELVRNTAGVIGIDTSYSSWIGTE